MSATKLLSQGQRLLARAFPAEIVINGRPYRAATNGLRRGLDIGDGPGTSIRAVSFWLPVRLFKNAREPVPTEQHPLFWNEVEYRIETVFLDPQEINVTLNCVAKGQ